MQTNVAIEIQDLYVDYRTKNFFKSSKFTALKNININIYSNAITIFLGNNGSGKSTLLNSILNFMKFKGSIKFSSVPDKIGYVPEVISPYEFLTGYQFLKLFWDLYHNKTDTKLRKEEISKVVNFLNISEYINKKIKTYSKGNKQKLIIAQALLGNPEILIFDEPESGLDPKSRVDLRDTLVRLKNDKKTIIISTHLIEEIESIVDYVVIIKNGEIIKQMKRSDFENYETLKIETPNKSEAEKISKLFHDRQSIIKEKDNTYLTYVLVNKNTDIMQIQSTFQQNNIQINGISKIPKTLYFFYELANIPEEKEN